jgi:hypothetical protein
MKPTLIVPISERLKLKCDDLLSTFAFNFKLRLYNKESLLLLDDVDGMVGRGRLTLSNPC